MSLRDTIRYQFNRAGSAVNQIILVNIIMFLFTIIIGFLAKLMGADANDLLQYFALSSNFGTTLIRPWTIITNIFMHAGFSHIFWNMILLFFIGRILEDFLSSDKIWKIFLFGGIAGGLFFLAGINLAPGLMEHSGRSLVGASGGVTAIIVATGLFLPLYTVRPFGLFSVQMRWVALFFVFRDLYTFPYTNNAGGLLAHLGGAILGVFFIRYIQGRIKLPKINLGLGRRKKPDERTFVRRRPDRKPNQDEIDAILDKISHSGYDSLTEKEKDTLFRAGN